MGKKASVVPPIMAGLISVIVNYGGTFILIFQAAQMAGLSPEQTASWVWSISIGVGITGILLSWYTKEPIITAWSTPAAAFLITALVTVSYSEAIGAYIISALAFVILGLSGYFEKLIKLIPPGIASGLLAGILLQFGIAAFLNMSITPVLAISLFIIYLLTKRFSPRYAIVSVLVFGFIILTLQSQVNFAGFEFKLAYPLFTEPTFSMNATLSVALPLFLITLTGQYMPGLIILKNDGFKTKAKPILAITGVGSIIMAPFGSHAFNLSSIASAICTGKEAHEDPSKRWIAGVTAGIFYIIVGLFGVTLAAIFAAFPATFISSLAGLALLSTITGSLSSAMSEENTREAAVITFLATAANINIFGISGAFWGLVLGITAYFILNLKLKKAK
ncbi:Inner membrane protein YdcO [Aliarcobacter thereius]|uniref:Benzoate/H(+) symporter BenE family transporter n=2 Tax=Aliarcobacter thereius TaxID=544718 RepID=A0A5R9H5I5_9BACT|nr:benzoate/H(+) symporter BenE family transporter [Aliarcobacter thereius]OCL86456.1 Inner membrane protein YdcO [Aliarcobacter thereius]OCL96258.1 Inner membrane protein YdcO [Aliarcobacter thereius LMG 24486]QBF15777.1 benzoate:proton symporter BenE [Aliarcobacter thereius LMG 24486]TLS71342.1 benzoate/H(+) symporter BenE family transporter [Aliarcobacter thereius]TLS92444.1 benzoate/H(+) symporter BenE family transporter [Aliarcobacter thereius]